MRASRALPDDIIAELKGQEALDGAGVTGLASVAANTHVQTLEVLEVIAETADAGVSGAGVPDSPGPQIPLSTRPVPDGARTGPDGEMSSVARCYCCRAPRLDDQLVTVKRVPGGYASNWICDHRAGDHLTVLLPVGKFVPDRCTRIYC